MPTKKVTTTKKPVRKEKKEIKEKEIKPKEVKAEIKEESKEEKKEKYFQAVGRRKESIAIVRLYTKKSTDVVEDDKALIIVNGKDYGQYFTDKNLQLVIESALKKLKSPNRFKATVMVHGGGLAGQAGAIMHGL